MSWAASNAKKKRLKNPEVCGRCHEKQLEEYRESDHGKAVLEKGDSDSAVCSDCHTTHKIASPEEDAAKLAITSNCGNCHEDAQRTYFASYHGQVHRLGYTNTAKCYDCHGSHKIKGEDDPTSEIHANNRLENCRSCHEDANDNFLSFWPHGDADDRENYLGLWFFKIFMQLLIFSVMAFFWIHVLMWLYREVMERIQGKGFIEDLDHPEVVYFRRFPTVWTWIHALFAISTMVLILTGTTLLFSHTAWARRSWYSSAARRWRDHPSHCGRHLAGYLHCPPGDCAQQHLDQTCHVRVVRQHVHAAQLEGLG